MAVKSISDELDDILEAELEAVLAAELGVDDVVVAVEEEAAVQPPPLKRQCCSTVEEPDWKITFAQSVLLRTFCENVGNILTECYFEVVHSEEQDGFSGLSVESIDQGRVCLIQARLSGQVSVSPRAPTGPRGFCVRMSLLTSSLKAGHACHFVDLWQPAKSSDVVFRIYEPNVSNAAQEFTLHTLAKENDCPGLTGLEYNLFVEIDLDTFRGAIRLAREHKADVMTIAVYTPKKQQTGSDDDKASSSSRDHSLSTNVSFFVISYDADEISAKFPYPSSTVSEAHVDGKPTVIRANDTSKLDLTGLPPQDSLDTIFCDRFGAEQLYNFVRGMERREVTLRLDNGKPLLLEYPLGGSSRTDYIRFVLAPKLQ